MCVCVCVCVCVCLCVYVSMCLHSLHHLKVKGLSPTTYTDSKMIEQSTSTIHTQGKLLTLPANVRLGQFGIVTKNTLAYYLNLYFYDTEFNRNPFSNFKFSLNFI